MAWSGERNISSAVDADIEFTMMSVSKPFIVSALVCDLIGPEAARANGGLFPLNSLAGVEFSKDGRTKSEAIATASPPAQMCSYPIG
jgi:glutaminase